MLLSHESQNYDEGCRFRQIGNAFRGINKSLICSLYSLRYYWLFPSTVLLDLFKVPSWRRRVWGEGGVEGDWERQRMSTLSSDQFSLEL